MYPSLVSNVRGVGTLLAFDSKDNTTINKLVHLLKQAGIESGSCGTRTLRFRPSLIFTPSHAAITLNILESTLKTLS
jgi:4-aminobutyrate aminotransferase/(S)-3-amino-2-methylpropionate transaminase